MFRLSVLGQIELRDASGNDVRAVLAQPKRLALLVFLAASRPHGFHRRDALMVLFWPDLPEQRARNALRQALHQLRLALGSDVLTSRGADSLAVDLGRVECDAVSFEDALDRGRLTDALQHYAGDLLPGFSVDGADGFNAWLDETRARLCHRVARAAWALAEQCERAGRSTEAMEFARRAAELTTDDEPALRRIVALLDRLGDSTGAIRAYENFVKHLRRELDLAPAPETRALAKAIRTRVPKAVPVPHSDAVDRPSTTPGPQRTRVARPTLLLHGFHNLTGDPSFDFVGRLATTEIRQALNASRLVDVHERDAPDRANDAAPIAEDRAAIAVAGSYHLVEDGWRFEATLRAAIGGRSLASISMVSARRERPWEAAQELGRRVSGAVAGHLDPQVASWAEVVTEPPSLDAHRAHLLGMELHLRGQYRDAITHFLAAANLDEGFTIPMLWSIQASCNLEEFEQADAIYRELTAHRSRLSPAEQLGCDYFGALLSGDRGAAFRLLRRVSELVPDSEVLAQLGRAAVLFNHPRYAAEVLERLDPEVGWIPSWTPYWRRLTEAYHMLGDHRRECESAQRGRRQHPESIATLLYEARAYAALGDIDATRRIADEAVSLASDPFATVGDVLFTAARELRAHGNPAAGATHLARAIDWQRDHCSADRNSASARMSLARMLYDAGQWEDASATLVTLQRERPDDVDVLGCLGCISAREGNESAARGALSTLRRKTGRFHFGKHLLWSARIASVIGDSDDAQSLLRGAFARGCSYDIDLHTDVDLSLMSRHEWFREILRAKG